MPVRFHFQINTQLPDRIRLKKFISQLFLREGKTLGDLDYIFMGDEDLWLMNRQFLQHDDYTDILTFDQSEPGSGDITGEIYISIDRVKDNAAQFGETGLRELHRVIFHGALHLCGFKDKTSREQAIMRSKEDEYLQLYFQG